MEYVPAEIEAYEEAVESALQSVKYTGLNIRHSSFWQELRNKLSELLERIIRVIADTFNLSSSNIDRINYSLVSNVILIVCVAILVLLAAYLIFKLTKSRRKQNAPVLDDSNQELLDRHSVPALLKIAARLEQEGNYAEALRYGFIGLIKSMYEKGIISSDQKKTNGQIILELKYKQFPAVSDFQQVVAGFNKSYYGKKGLTAESYKQWLAFYTAFYRGVASFGN